MRLDAKRHIAGSTDVKRSVVALMRRSLTGLACSSPCFSRSQPMDTRVRFCSFFHRCRLLRVVASLWPRAALALLPWKLCRS
jgi:hypothetical protein